MEVPLMRLLASKFKQKIREKKGQKHYRRGDNEFGYIKMWRRTNHTKEAACKMIITIFIHF